MQRSTQDSSQHSTPSQENIAIIGAGLAGAVLAQQLSDAGHSVTVLEKSRGTGGRLSSCRIGDLSADLGAPWFVPSTPMFRHWLEQQALQPWQPTIEDFGGNQVSSQPIWLATPRQSALTRQLLASSTLRTSIRVGSVWPEQENGQSRIVVRDEHDEVIGYFDKVFITAPAQQAAPLLEAIPRFSAVAAQATTEACWVSVIITEPLAQTTDIFCGEHPVLYRCIRNSSKPGRNNTGPDDNTQEVWVIEANSQWSNERIDASPDSITEQLLQHFSEIIGRPIHCKGQRTHRWLLARHSNTVKDTCLWDPDTGIGACGDWLAECGLEGSWQSAMALADKVIHTGRD